MLKMKRATNTLKKVFVWGYAGTGSLGEVQFLRPKGEKSRVYHQRQPWRLKWADKVRAEPTHVACGNGFTLMSVSNTFGHKGHQLFGTGINTESQIGVHETSKGDSFKYLIQPAFIQLPINVNDQSSLKILGLACGRAHSLVLTNLGVITFGNNSYGQCGRPIVENEEYYGNRAVMQNIQKYFELESEDSIVSIKAGQDHSCFLTQKGHVYTCGWSSDGQLGQDIYTVGWRPKRVKGDLDGNKIVQIATKGDFVLALSDKGEIFGWGNNEYSQLKMSGIKEPQVGLPRHLKLPSHIKHPIVGIAASGTHCLALDSDNQVWTWGFGLLGRGPKCEETAEPLTIPETLFGRYKDIAHSMVRRITSLSCGLNSSAAILDDGSLYMWGKNRYGNLGIGEKTDAYFPIRVSVPARVHSIDCGPDQTFTICKV